MLGARRVQCAGGSCPVTQFYDVQGSPSLFAEVPGVSKFKLSIQQHLKSLPNVIMSIMSITGEKKTLEQR